jgi:hypothetical protein
VPPGFFFDREDGMESPIGIGNVTLGTTTTIDPNEPANPIAGPTPVEIPTVEADQFTPFEQQVFAWLSEGDVVNIRSTLAAGIDPLALTNADGEWFVSLAHSKPGVFRLLREHIPDEAIADALKGAAAAKAAQDAAAAQHPSLVADQKEPDDPANAIHPELWAFMVKNNWPRHHDGWHQLHQFGGMFPENGPLPVAGYPVGGIEFGAFHEVKIERVLAEIEVLAKQYLEDIGNGIAPDDARGLSPEEAGQARAMMKGWTAVETNPSSPNYPFGDRQISSDLLERIARFEDLDGLAASMAPTFDKSDRWTVPDAHRLEPGQTGTPGIFGPLNRMLAELEDLHGELHGLMSRGDSNIDMGPPKTNIFNVLFWGLHGWVQSRIDGFIAAFKAKYQDEPGILGSFEAEVQLYEERKLAGIEMLKPDGHALHGLPEVPAIFLNHPPIG